MNFYFIFKEPKNLLSAKHSLKIGKHLFFQKSQIHIFFWNVASGNKKRVLEHANKNPPQCSFSHDRLSANQKQERNVYKKETLSIN
jgi:hypothetical protein